MVTQKKSTALQKKIKRFAKQQKIEIFTDLSTRLLYATDASAYKVVPAAVAYPRKKDDLKALVNFATRYGTSLIPRTAGTSLAGQCVGKGIVLDLSRYFNKVLEVNKNERWALVEPGVILSDLNKQLQKHDLFFAPETSTANRVMIGGMVGNNACGLHSLIYGSTREHLLETEMILHDGSIAVFKDLSEDDYNIILQIKDTEGNIYQNMHRLISDSTLWKHVQENFPKAAIPRRNTGYAIDKIMQEAFFNSQNSFKLNYAKLLAGSEGTLGIFSAFKIRLLPLEKKEKALLCIHFHSIQEALEANTQILQFNPSAIELMDRTVLNLTKENLNQQRNRFFIEGDPKCILIVEILDKNKSAIQILAKNIENHLRSKGFGYSFPLITGENIEKVWNLRRAGLGVLSNVEGDSKPVAVIEDTAVEVSDLPHFIREFNALLSNNNLQNIYYAHVGSGELHLRPLINLKTEAGNQLFRNIALETAKLVKKYNGSLSGEHGDGRLRSEFIPFFFGPHVYKAFEAIKQIWDPKNIFNPGKITMAVTMNTDLRYMPGHQNQVYDTIFDFSKEGGFVRAIEKCNGSADCRKTHITGGTMCPSYMATRDEHKSTRARANLLRELLSFPRKKNPFSQKELYDILDLCLSCKGCKSECPSNVDMALIKAEFMQHYRQNKIPSLRTILFAHFTSLYKNLQVIAPVANAFLRPGPISYLLKKTGRIAVKRNLPLIQKQCLTKKITKEDILSNSANGKEIFLFIDEFTNYQDSETGLQVIRLLQKLGYRISILPIFDSGRSLLSKGFVKSAKKIADINIRSIQFLVKTNTIIVGIEPSALLTFRDEYPKLVSKELKEITEKISKRFFLFEEFMTNENNNGTISASNFKKESKKILVHGHCHQKALSDKTYLLKTLSIPSGFQVEEIPSGCCGMAGSFGYEKEHYELSMAVGNLVLFPVIKKTDENIIISAPGTSCRQQIFDGTGKKAFHPAKILLDALQ